MEGPIAIVGIGCRLPGNANNSTAFWQTLSQGKDTITEIPKDRWSIDSYFHPDHALRGMSYSRWGGFLQDIDQFEPEYFGISPREAATMDPQQRLLLETTIESLEDAGLPPTSLRGSSTGVFIGASATDYGRIQADISDLSTLNPYSSTGTVLSLTANRISYCLDLRGPSMAVDTACSSSLLATHLACQSLWRGDCNLALAGGANILISPDIYVGFSQMSMLSPTGRCKAFDADADGFVRSEGIGVVALQPLSVALQMGSPIYALIKASGTNQDGRTNGITVPNPQAQKTLLKDTYKQAGIKLGDVDFVEAHGTGTFVGDPIEAEALGQAFSEGRDKNNACWVGCVKTNIGHLEAAAGIAGLIKTALVLKNRRVPANLHFKNPNPQIDFGQLQLKIPQQLTEFPKSDKQLYAGVNSFGFGGANVHVVLEEFSANKKTSNTQPKIQQSQFILPLTARSPEALHGLIESYDKYLAENNTKDNVSLADICYSATFHRNEEDYRAAIVVRSKDELSEQLQHWKKEQLAKKVSSVAQKKQTLAFIYCGQGPQWLGMGVKLLKTEPVFRDTMMKCDAVVRRLGQWSLIDALMATEADSQLHKTSVSQPAIFAIQASLTTLLQSWGIVPDLVIGHSVGEIAAAFAAGAYSLEVATEIIFYRGLCMDLPSSLGKMLAAGISEQTAKQWICNNADKVSIAAINSPSAVTLSGDGEILADIADQLVKQDIFCKFLRVDYAFHSPAMDPVAEKIKIKLKNLKPHALKIPMISTVTGNYIEGEQLTVDYWVRSVRESVLFTKAIQKALEDKHTTLIEIGPHPVLSASIKETAQSINCTPQIFSSLYRDEPEISALYAMLCGVFNQGSLVNWKALWPSGHGKFVRIPGHAWQRKKFWNEPLHIKKLRVDPNPHPFLKPTPQMADGVWTMLLDPDRFSYLKDHCVREEMVFPGAGYMEIMFAIAKCAGKEDYYQLEDLDFVKALMLSETQAPMLQIIKPSHSNEVRIFSAEAGTDTWSLHATGNISGYAKKIPNNFNLNDRMSFQQQAFKTLSHETIYANFCRFGLNYGPACQGISKLWCKKNEAMASIKVPENIVDEVSHYLFHPALLDACLQVCAYTTPERLENDESVYLLVHADRILCYAKPTEEIWVLAKVRRKTEKTVENDIYIYDECGKPLAIVEGLISQKAGNLRRAQTANLDNKLYQVEWQHQPLSAEQPRAELIANTTVFNQAIHTSDKAFMMHTANPNNTFISKVIQGVINQLPKGRLIRLLHIANNSSELAAEVLSILPEKFIQYFFTTVSEDALNVGRQRLRDYSGVKFELLQIKSDQINLTPNSFDLILVCDSLDQQQDLTKITNLLVNGGVLFLQQPSEALKYTDFQSVHHLENLVIARTEIAIEKPVLKKMQQSGQWLIFIDELGLGDKIINALRLSQQQVTVMLPTDDKQKVESVVHSFLQEYQGICGGILFLSAITQQPHQLDCDYLKSQEKLGCHTLMVIAQTLAKAQTSLPALYIVTQGAQALDDENATINIAQAPLCGMARVICNENPDLRVKHIDLDPEVSEFNLESLWNELLQGDEEELIFRGGSRWVPRMLRSRLQELPRQLTNNAFTNAASFQLKIMHHNTVDGLALMQTERAPLADNDVEIKVHAVGLNFRDVLKTLGIYPTDCDDYLALGDECAGVISAKGANVTEFEIGDEVMGIGQGCFGSTAKVYAQFVMKKPTHFSFFEAATIPIVFLTAYYCLHHIGHIAKGDKILIQAAAGGVGLAAIQIAQHMGAEIFATASQPKWPLLHQLGVKHVMDSRSLSFADEVLELTQGQGVDIVLNSLAGEAIPKGISTLGAYGKFIEIGKRDIYEKKKIGLHQLRNNLSFNVVDLSRVMSKSPTLVQSILRELSGYFEKGIFQPLHHKCFGINHVKHAFRYMSQGKHQGKIVISMQEMDIKIKPELKPLTTFSAQKTYLISGGLGGFGLSLARWLVDLGAKHLVLLSRGGITTESQQYLVSKLQSFGASVDVVKADVSDPAQMSQLFNQIKKNHPPLGGIFHLAMVMDDAVLLKLNATRFSTVMQPKVLGAWNLHQLSLNMNLDHFVAFSSMSSQAGNPGQANYAAANAFLDSLVAYRHALNLPCVSVNWGHILEVGYVCSHQKVKDMLIKSGDPGITPNEAFTVLAYLLQHNASAAFANIDWQVLIEKNSNNKLLQRFSSFINENAQQSSQHREKHYLRKLIQKADPATRHSLIESYLCDQIAKILSLPKDKIPLEQEINTLGLDSLMAIELNNQVKNDLSTTIPVAELIDGTTIKKLSAVLLEKTQDNSDLPSENLSAPKTSSSPALVTLKPGNSKAALFCIHTVGGMMDVYQPLAKAWTLDVALYGIASRVQTEDDKSEHNTIDAMIKDYVEKIKAQQPQGPYALFGYSAGAMFTLEVAKRLEQQGETVKFLGLVDPIVVSLTENTEQEKLLGIYIKLILNSFATTGLTDSKAATSIEQLTQQVLLEPSGDQQRQLVINWIMQNLHFDDADAIARVDRYLALIQQHLELLLFCKADNLQCAITVWWPEHTFSDKTIQESRLRARTTGEIITKSVPGDHLSVMKPPIIQQITNDINHYWHSQQDRVLV